MSQKIIDIFASCNLPMPNIQPVYALGMEKVSSRRFQEANEIICQRQSGFSHDRRNLSCTQLIWHSAFGKKYISLLQEVHISIFFQPKSDTSPAGAEQMQSFFPYAHESLDMQSIQNIQTLLDHSARNKVKSIPLTNCFCIKLEHKFPKLQSFSFLFLTE